MKSRRRVNSTVMRLGVESDNFMNSSMPMVAMVIRWTARVLSGVILFFWGLLLVAHLVGDARQPC